MKITESRLKYFNNIHSKLLEFAEEYIRLIYELDGDIVVLSMSDDTIIFQLTNQTDTFFPEIPISLICDDNWKTTVLSHPPLDNP